MSIRTPAVVFALVLGACSPGTKGTESRTADTTDTITRAAATKTEAEPTRFEWQIAVGDSAGTLNRETSEAELRRRHGANAIGWIRIQLGEGETAPGTVLYPGDSLRHLEILWQDTVRRSRPVRVILRGSRSQWQVDRGVTLGTSLQELERLNGRPFTLAGFGWDYGGVVTDWAGGALDSSLTGVKLYLDPGPAQYHSSAYSQVLGDRDYSSSSSAMQELAPRVAQIFVDFE